MGEILYYVFIYYTDNFVVQSCSYTIRPATLHLTREIPSIARSTSLQTMMTKKLRGIVDLYLPAVSSP